ncbi:DUF6478 family protein [Yoonia sp. BS5-3]|uniref:DUF6478 family protein n=1 Tax=Yoonia phaeophyticola TaxID=3137369 RepID=A0ABZ2V3X6_9RHOB
MAISQHSLIGRLLHERTLARWRRAARNAGNAELGSLRTQRKQARQLFASLQELAHVADARLALPRIGSTTFPRPAGTDWSWRPKAWRSTYIGGGAAPAENKSGVGDELTLFHDCPQSEVTLRQIRNKGEADFAPFGLTLEVFHFAGSFLSLVIEVPPASCNGLQKRHLIQLGAAIDREAPITIHARLNVKHGPNVEQILMTLPDEGGDVAVEFDLAYSQLNEKRAERMWIDLMFENPSMNRIALRDINLSRHPRAEI